MDGDVMTLSHMDTVADLMFSFRVRQQFIALYPGLRAIGEVDPKKRVTEFIIRNSYPL